MLAPRPAQGWLTWINAGLLPLMEIAGSSASVFPPDADACWPFGAAAVPLLPLRCRRPFVCRRPFPPRSRRADHHLMTAPGCLCPDLVAFHAIDGEGRNVEVGGSADSACERFHRT